MIIPPTKHNRPKNKPEKIRVLDSQIFVLIGQKVMHLNHDFYVFVGKQCRTENE